MVERFNISRVREIVSKHEAHIGGVLTIGSVLYLDALNKALGIDNDLNPITLTEIGLVGLTASFFGASIRMRVKPSEMIKDVFQLTRQAFKKNNSK